MMDGYTTKTTDPVEREKIGRLRDLVVITRDINDKAFANAFQALYPTEKFEAIRDILWEIDFHLTDLLVYEPVNPKPYPPRSYLP